MKSDKALPGPASGKMALSVKGAALECNLGINTMYEAARKGLLKMRKLGRRTIILRADLEAYLAELPALDLAKNPSTPECRNLNPIGKRKAAQASTQAAI